MECFQQSGSSPLGPGQGTSLDEIKHDETPMAILPALAGRLIVSGAKMPMYDTDK